MGRKKNKGAASLNKVNQKAEANAGQATRDGDGGDKAAPAPAAPGSDAPAPSQAEAASASANASLGEVLVAAVVEAYASGIGFNMVLIGLVLARSGDLSPLATRAVVATAVFLIGECVAGPLGVTINPMVRHARYMGGELPGLFASLVTMVAQVVGAIVAFKLFLSLGLPAVLTRAVPPPVVREDTAMLALEWEFALSFVQAFIVLGGARGLRFLRDRTFQQGDEPWYSHAVCFAVACTVLSGCSMNPAGFLATAYMAGLRDPATLALYSLAPLSASWFATRLAERIPRGAWVFDEERKCLMPSDPVVVEAMVRAERDAEQAKKDRIERLLRPAPIIEDPTLSEPKSKAAMAEEQLRLRKADEQQGKAGEAAAPEAGKKGKKKKD